MRTTNLPGFALASIYCLGLSIMVGCSTPSPTTPPAPQIPLPHVQETQPDTIQGAQLETPTFGTLLKNQKLNFIKTTCTYLSLSGEVVARLPGNQCQLYPDDTRVIGHSDVLYAEDKMKRQIWEIKKFYSHHQIKISEINDDLLTMNSLYTQHPKYIWMRSDQIVVVTKDGRISKSFSFLDYYRKTRFASVPRKNTWSTDSYQNISYERTHINSFSEIYTVKNDRKILTGYVAYCAHLKKLYVFDTELKNIVKVIDMKGRAAHDVQQYSENELIYFLNFKSEEKQTRSRIEILDLKNEKFKKLYVNKSFKQHFAACGSVQTLPGHQLFVFYSSCSPLQKNRVERSYFELVDLKTLKNEILSVGDWPWRQSAYLVNSAPEAE